MFSKLIYRYIHIKPLNCNKILSELSQYDKNFIKPKKIYKNDEIGDDSYDNNNEEEIDYFSMCKYIYKKYKDNINEIQEDSIPYYLKYTGLLGFTNQSIDIFNTYKNHKTPDVNLCREYLASLRYCLDQTILNRELKLVLGMHPNEQDFIASYCSLLYKNNKINEIYDYYKKIDGKKLNNNMFKIMLITCNHDKNSLKLAKHIWDKQNPGIKYIGSEHFLIYLNILNHNKCFKDILDVTKDIVNENPNLLTEESLNIINSSSKICRSYDVLNSATSAFLFKTNKQYKDEKVEFSVKKKIYDLYFFSSAIINNKENIELLSKYYEQSKNDITFELLYTLQCFNSDLYNNALQVILESTEKKCKKVLLYLFDLLYYEKKYNNIYDTYKYLLYNDRSFELDIIKPYVYLSIQHLLKQNHNISDEINDDLIKESEEFYNNLLSTSYEDEEKKAQNYKNYYYESPSLPFRYRDGVLNDVIEKLKNDNEKLDQFIIGYFKCKSKHLNDIVLNAYKGSSLNIPEEITKLL